MCVFLCVCVCACVVCVCMCVCVGEFVHVYECVSQSSFKFRVLAIFYVCGGFLRGKVVNGGGDATGRNDQP